MTRNILHYQFALIFFLVHVLAEVHGQTKEDSIVSADTIRNRFVPTGIRVGTDVISLVKSRFQDDFNGWEVQGDVDFSRYYFVLELGHGGRNFSAPTATYANSGNYWRTGVDVNFLTNDVDRNMFFLGARYGKSVFGETMSISRDHPVWGSLSETFHHSGISASWIELTTGLKVKIWQIFWLGCTARLKFGLSTDNSAEMLVSDVPGFGRTNKETTWGFNYYLLVRLPIRKAPVPVTKKK